MHLPTLLRRLPGVFAPLATALRRQAPARASAAGARAPLDPEVLAAIRDISMLREDALSMLASLAREAEGMILEIGTYIGGSTVAIALGSRSRVIAIEVGTPHPHHESMPSSDVLGDLRRNLRRFGVEERVSVIPRLATSPLAFREVAALLDGGSIGMMAVDADGDIGRHLGRFAPLLTPRCLLAIDDYDAPGAQAKEALVRPWVDARVSDGTLDAIGVVGWGTWCGRLGGEAARDRIAAEWTPYRRESGHAWCCEVLLPEAPDSASDPRTSRARLIEREGAARIELGPAHAWHDEIRRLGAGRFSHWSEAKPDADLSEHEAMLYFSTSDNSDPTANGRSYEIAIGRSTFALRDPRR
ncbi:MAG TPA: hypothetical protein PKC43_11975 [Phycisphaerales bacterium]|nr:hypothetical protein [Phycisphaerales bacterium]HMP38149.1 hypothetical protein [Phycisphaerales bacterium]